LKWYKKLCQAACFLFLSSGILPAQKAAAEMPSDGLIRTLDADGCEWVLNKPGRVMVVICGNSSDQDDLRACGKSLDEFQGRRDFRAIVVVDLRGSLANLAKGYTCRRMSRGLDAEALRIKPIYRDKGNRGDPRPDIGSVADFDGQLCTRLGWGVAEKGVRTVVFDKGGTEKYRGRFPDNAGDLRKAVAKLVDASK